MRRLVLRGAVPDSSTTYNPNGRTCPYSKVVVFEAVCLDVGEGNRVRRAGGQAIEQTRGLVTRNAIEPYDNVLEIRARAARPKIEGVRTDRLRTSADYAEALGADVAGERVIALEQRSVEVVVEARSVTVPLHLQARHILVIAVRPWQIHGPVNHIHTL